LTLRVPFPFFEREYNKIIVGFACAEALFPRAWA
jgi:hypothetical protein